MEAKIHPWFDPGMLVGTTLQGYKLVEFLGAGGFGAVYRTANPQGQPWAIKVLYPPHSLFGEDVRVWNARATHFLQEANTATRFNHPNIIKVYGVGQVNWHYNDPLQGRQGHQDRSGGYTLDFYVAEYIPDGVDQRLKDSRLFTPDEAVSIGIQVCEALKLLHSATPQVLHRDLNPGNIRLPEDGRAVVTDFGVARIEGLPGAYITTEGPLVHRGVSAPEQFAGEEPDVRTDIFQFGALLLMMLTGKYPRQGDPRALMDQRGVPKGLAQTILRCLETERTKRFPDAANLKVALLGNATRHAADPERQVGLWRRSLVNAWELRLESACWRTRTTPVLEGDGFYLWDSRTVYRLRPENGTTMWTWDTSGPIGDAFQNPAVQLGGGLIYVRHGAFLSCLDGHAAEQWRGKFRSEVTGAFLAAGDVIIVNSYGDGSGGLRDLAGLDAQSGETVWALQEDEYHVDHLAASDEALFLVESIGLAASGGLRVRSLDLATGKLVGVYQLADQNHEAETPFGRLPLLRLCPPLVTPDGGIAVGVSSRLQARHHLLCLDRSCSARWSQIIDLGGAHSPREVYLAAAQDQLLVCLVTREHSGGLDQGWLAGIDLRTGERLWERKCPEDAALSHPAGAPKESLAFAIAHDTRKRKKNVRPWRLTALDLRSGEELWRGPERESPHDSTPLGPVVTSTRVYLQAPQAPLHDKGRLAGGVGRGVIQAFQRQ